MKSAVLNWKWRSFEDCFILPFFSILKSEKEAMSFETFLKGDFFGGGGRLDLNKLFL